MNPINRVKIAELQKLNGKNYSDAALKSAIYAAGASYREAKDLFSGANVWENFKLELDKKHPELEQQAKRKWNLAVKTATEIGLKVLRNNWNDRKDLNLGLSFEHLEKEIADSTLLKKPHSDEQSDGEIPTREEIEKILEKIAHDRREVNEDLLKSSIEVTFKLENRMLMPGWWEITKRNLTEWSRRK